MVIDDNLLFAAVKVVEAYELAIKPIYKALTLSKTDFKVLLFIHSNPKTTAKEISNILGIKPNLVSMSIDNLVDKKLIQLERNELDKREIFLFATCKVLDIVKSVEKAKEEAVKRVKLILKKSEVNRIKKYLGDI